MTCETMLERMLIADPGELLGHGATPLASHLRDCARCRVVAEQLLGETRELATALARGARRVAPEPPLIGRSAGSMRRRVAASGLLVAAAVVAIAFWPTTRSGVSPAPTTSAGVVPPPVANAARTDPTPNTHSPSPAAAVSSGLAHGSPIHADQFPPPKPITSEAVASAGVMPRATSHAPPRLIVRPPRGVRAAVLQTANPTITVVWLY